MTRFMRTSMNSERVPFAVSIDKFSLYTRRGYYEGPELQGEESGSKWSLVLLASEGDGYEDFIEVQLRRNESKVRNQFVELKLSIVDCFGFNGLSKKEQYSFTGSRDTHKVLSVNRMSRLGKLRYLPNDTLTLKGEMIIYEEMEKPFEREEDFRNSLKNSNPALVPALWWILLGAATCAYKSAALAWRITSAIMYILAPFLYAALLWFKSQLPNIWHFIKQQFRGEDDNGSHRELVPATYGRNKKNFSNAEYYHKPLNNGDYAGKNMVCVFVDENYFKSMKTGRHGQYNKFPSDTDNYYKRRNRNYLCE